MTERFNPPPSWPEPPHDGWRPPAGFRPRKDFAPVPAGWRLWVAEEQDDRSSAPLQDSEDVPASGARPRARVESYPVTVLNPGMWSQNQLEDEDYGFPPARERMHRPRRRLAGEITATALGLAIAAAVAVGFVWLTDFGIHDLTGFLAENAGFVSGA